MTALPGEADGARTLGNLFNRRRVTFYCGVAIAVEIAVFVFMVAGTHGLIVPLPKPTTTDFVSFYAAGALADDGRPELSYDAAHHHAAEERATAVGIEHNFFYYPPVFLILCAALAHLPYLAAFILFEASTLGLYVFAVRRILPGRPWTDLLPAMAFPAVFWNFGFGQNAFLTAALFAGGTLLVDRRPLFAGLLFGALSYKPQFALLVPVALIAGQHWRALAGAGASAAALCVLSLGLFGGETWESFFSAAISSPAVYTTGRIPFSGYINPFGAVRLLGGDQTTAYIAQALAILVAGALVAFSWHRSLALPIRAAVLASATLVAAPLALFYDLLLGAVAAVWLMHDDVEADASDWEKLALSALFVLSLSPRSIAEFLHFPVGALIVLTLAGIIAARALPKHRVRFAPAVAVLAAGAERRGA